jgi:hypothetical protein
MYWTTDGNWIEGTGYRNHTRLLALTEDEAPLLHLALPALKRKLVFLERRYEYFSGLHEAGIATSLQEDRRLYYEELCTLYRDTIRDIPKLIASRKHK